MDANVEQMERVRSVTRRHFFGQLKVGIGAIALATLFQELPAAVPNGAPLAPKAPLSRWRRVVALTGPLPLPSLFRGLLIKRSVQFCYWLACAGRQPSTGSGPPH